MKIFSTLLLCSFLMLRERVRPFGPIMVLAALIAIPQSLLGQEIPRIEVGANTRISVAEPNKNHVEVIADADPNDPNRIIACSMVETRPLKMIRSVAYVSRDGGVTWKKSIETERGGWDPDCHFSADGTAYFSANWASRTGAEKQPTEVRLYRSSNGGRKWDGPHITLGSVDRQWLGVDRTDRRSSPLYLYYAAKIQPYDGGDYTYAIQLKTSTDQGKTFANPATMLMPSKDRDLANARPVLLSDGTLVILLSRALKPAESKPEMGPPRTRSQRGLKPTEGALTVVFSRDGGATLGDPVKIADQANAEGRTNRVVPTIAVDPGSAVFKDRIYVTWADMRSGRSEIMESHSSDKGKTWSTPKVIGDSYSTEGQPYPDDFQATVAVNKDGVVGVMWYDRREIADNVGYNARFTASLDGGETWLPSVLLSEEPNRFEAQEFPDIWLDTVQPDDGGSAGVTTEFTPSTWLIGGHTAGLAVTADGSFLPVWVDNRTRYQQLWTAKVTVSGTVSKNGSPELASLADFSHTVTLDMNNVSFDRTTNILTVTARLENTGDSTVRGPLKARVVTLRSELGATPTLLGSDNGRSGTGAIWDFSSQMPEAGLAPGEWSRPKEVRFHFANLGSTLRDGMIYGGRLLKVEARILGPSQAQ